MSDFTTYYSNLSEWEEKPAVELVAAWVPDEVTSIANEFKTALGRADFSKNQLTVPAGVSNQSIGNKVAEFFTKGVNQQLQNLRVENCSGAGYPDKRLTRLSDRKVYAFELKATSQFDPNDSNRIVLTSSSEKLRRYFSPPICHLLATACYSQQGQQICIGNLRLDFLQPDTAVNVRLEASVSQRILSRGGHPNFVF